MRLYAVIIKIDKGPWSINYGCLRSRVIAELAIKRNERSWEKSKSKKIRKYQIVTQERAEKICKSTLQY